MTAHVLVPAAMHWRLNTLATEPTAKQTP